MNRIKKLIPKNVFSFFAPMYHYGWAILGALIYRFPSKKIRVIAITGTKGKSSTSEMINAIFEAAGEKTALAGTIRFKIGDESHPNKTKMTMPGRMFVQRFLRRAVNAGCSTAILEISSEAAKQYRHKFIDLDALVFTNLSPEHIESHGSFEKYLAAKLSISESLCRKLKERSIVVANADDPVSKHFLECGAVEKFPLSLKDGEPYDANFSNIKFTWRDTQIVSPLRGVFNLYNCLAAATCADAFGLSISAIKEGLENLSLIKGRVEFVRLPEDNPLKEKQNFDVVVDYAHTADSLTQLYKAFGNQRKIAVLGNTGGGRDKWKRPEMAKVADTFCDEIILTNEDPYDESPDQIIEDMLPGFQKHEPQVIMDRKSAIKEAIFRAKGGDVVLITGKGTDPYIMLADGEKLPWSDYEVTRESLEEVLKSNA